MKSNTQKFTKLKGLKLFVSYTDIVSGNSFTYSKDFSKRPTEQERKEYLFEVLSKTGHISTSLLKPNK